MVFSPRFLAFLFTLCLGPVTAFSQEKVFTKKLPNGFTVYVIENHDQPQVFGAVAVRTGSKNDPASATGMAHYLEHLLFKGTDDMGTTDYEKEKVWLDSITRCYAQLGLTKDEAERMKIQMKINALSIQAGQYAIPNEMDRMLAEIGATGVNATTMVESTVYYNSFPSNQLNKWMDIYAHRFHNPVFRLFQPELEIVYEEKNRKMDEEFFQLFEYYLKQFFKKHPYGQQSAIGETEQLKNPPLQKIYDYFNTYYVPNNMALVLSGDVKHEEVFALAAQKFGPMIPRPVPAFPEYKEEPFKGAEKFQVRRTPFPVRGGVTGYRLPKNTDPDMPALDIIADLLSNSSSAGSIDKLLNRKKILMGGLEYMPYNDGGTAFLYFVPKPVIQSIGKSEKLVMGCLNDIKAGKFSDDALQAVKTNRTKSFSLSLESNYASANNVINAYVKGITPEEYLDYPKQIAALTREDIVRVANRYFGENSLTMYSRSGKVKKDKLAKPPFKPVVPKNETHSAYYNQWGKIPEGKINPHFVDFKKDIDSLNLAENTYLLRNQDPVNKVATMQLVFGTGTHYLPILAYADSYLLLCGTQHHEVNAFNERMYTLGCTFSIDAGSWQTVVRLNFPEENLEAVLALVKELLSEPVMSKKTMKKVAHDRFIGSFIERRSAEYYAHALNQYIVYGDKSPYLDKMGRREFKHSSTNELKKAIETTWKTSLKIMYTGTISTEKVSEALKQSGFVFNRTTAQPVYVIPRTDPKQNKVYLVNMRKARQSQVDLIKMGNVFSTLQLPVINAFNKYFGGDMSSLVFQEIREFRSLAYSTSGAYTIPVAQGYRCVFIANAGTQSDKTNDCISAMFDLVNNMPMHPERMAGLQNSLVQTAAAARPSFRGLLNTVDAWKRRGYTHDPNIDLLDAYPQLSFDQVEKFYRDNIQPQPTVICVTGKLKSFDTGTLKKYGPVKKIKKKKLVKA